MCSFSIVVAEFQALLCKQIQSHAIDVFVETVSREMVQARDEVMVVLRSQLSVEYTLEVDVGFFGNSFRRHVCLLDELLLNTRILLLSRFLLLHSALENTTCVAGL